MSGGDFQGNASANYFMYCSPYCVPSRVEIISIQGFGNRFIALLFEGTRSLIPVRFFEPRFSRTSYLLIRDLTGNKNGHVTALRCTGEEFSLCVCGEQKFMFFASDPITIQRSITLEPLLARKVSSHSLTMMSSITTFSTNMSPFLLLDESPQ